MKEYFVLQYKMLNRRMMDFGIAPWVGYTLIPIAFVLLSKYLFSKTEFAGYIYVLLAASLISQLSEAKRNDFLKSIFSLRNYRTLRLLENMLWSVPFLIFMAYEGVLIFVLGLGIVSTVMALFNFNTSTQFTIPTPFGNKPFEFAVGFRKTFFIFPIAYILTFMSIAIGNFNLGVFSMVLVGIVCVSYYSEPENEYFVWNFNVSPKTFLIKKIKIAYLHFSLVCLPIVCALSLFFFEKIWILLVFLLLAIFYLTTIVLAKYSAYPQKMNLPQGILIALSLLFPPILIGVIPFFYVQSVKHLNPFLNDSN